MHQGRRISFFFQTIDYDISLKQADPFFFLFLKRKRKGKRKFLCTQRVGAPEKKERPHNVGRN